MTPETITNRIHEKADEALRKRLEAIFNTARDTFATGSQVSIKVRGAYVQQTDNAAKEFLVDGNAALKTLEQLAFDNAKDRNRSDAVQAFMAKVESLGTEIDELRNSIEQ